MKKRTLISKISKKIDRVVHGGNISNFFIDIESLLIAYLIENYEKEGPKQL